MPGTSSVPMYTLATDTEVCLPTEQRSPSLESRGILCQYYVGSFEVSSLCICHEQHQSTSENDKNPGRHGTAALYANCIPGIHTCHDFQDVIIISARVCINVRVFVVSTLREARSKTL